MIEILVSAGNVQNVNSERPVSNEDYTKRNFHPTQSTKYDAANIPAIGTRDSTIMNT